MDILYTILKVVGVIIALIIGAYIKQKAYEHMRNMRNFKTIIYE